MGSSTQTPTRHGRESKLCADWRKGLLQETVLSMTSTQWALHNTYMLGQRETEKLLELLLEASGQSTDTIRAESEEDVFGNST